MELRNSYTHRYDFHDAFCTPKERVRNFSVVFQKREFVVVTLSLIASFSSISHFQLAEIFVAVNITCRSLSFEILLLVVGSRVIEHVNLSLSTFLSNKTLL